MGDIKSDMGFVGLHIGYSTVAASYINSSADVKHLKLVNTDECIVDKWRIPSCMYKYQDPDSGACVYSLDKPRWAHSLISEMKQPISYMDEAEKENYEAFIQLIVQRLKECNSELGEYFDLAIACPNRWSNEKKEEYKEFFNKALSVFGIRVYAIMSESDAILFSKYRQCDYARNILAVNYGSSTIDFTFVFKGKKVESSSNLGASAIERAVLATYASDENSNYASVHQMVDPILKQHAMEWSDMDKFILAQIRRKKEVMFTLRDRYLDEFHVRPYLITGIHELKRCDCIFKYELKEPLMEIPRVQEYVKHVKRVLIQLKARSKQYGGVDKIIISGEGCLMKWVEDIMREIFNPREIELSRYLDFDISDGLVKYCHSYHSIINASHTKIAR